jgi:hypothetical protein
VTDHDNALVHCREIVEMQGTGNATDLFRRMAQRAADLVAANQVMIRRVAHRLDQVGEMTGEQIEAILLEGCAPAGGVNFPAYRDRPGRRPDASSSDSSREPLPRPSTVLAASAVCSICLATREAGKDSTPQL